MPLQYRPLQSKFGRRLLALFVGCALLPIAVLAAVAFRQVSQQLHHQTEIRLRQGNRVLGAAIFERLLLLDATLKGIPPRALVQLDRPRRPADPAGPVATASAHDRQVFRKQAHGPAIDGGMALGGVRASEAPHLAVTSGADPGDVAARQALLAGLDLLARRRFAALEFVRDDAKRIPISRHLQRLPSLSPSDSANLRAGLPLILTEHRDATRDRVSETRVYMLRRLAGTREVRGIFVGEVSSQYLWGTLGQGAPSPTTTVTVIDGSGRVVFGPLAAPAPYMSDSLPIIVEKVFAAPSWTLVLGESRDAVLGPMVEFSITFLFVVLGSVLAVLLLSGSQIRRSLVPLQALQQGTRRIAESDFSSRVAVRSRDEFEELATSFNAMATQLGRQFTALATGAEIDRAILSATDASVIVGTVLDRIRDIVPCGAVSVTLTAADGTKSVTSLVQECGVERRRRAVRVDLRSDDVQALLAGPDVLEVAAASAPPSGLPSYLVPLGELGARSFVVLPLVYQRQLCGIIALARSGDLVSAQDDDLVQMRRLADQAAVALANARMLAQVRELAYCDSLTGLPNRVSHKERLACALEHAARTQKLVAVFFIDLDHFSRINDTLGHDVGDQLLQQVAVRLRSCCREREDDVGPADAALAPDVARLGGDEFTVIMPGLGDPQDAAKLARRILSGLAQPVRIGEHEIFVNASIGIAIYPLDGEDIETLLMHADSAMYKAKEQGGASYQTYSRAMTTTALHRLTLENDLRRALDREEFEAHYQPIVEARTGRVVGAEALVRWRHPELGVLLPSEFIPLAEENGLILPLGEWMLRAACIQNQAWQEAGLRPIRVAVNLSGRQLKRTLPETVSRILSATGLEPRYLGLELTESVLVNHSREGTDALHTLRAMGLHLSVDDFGTGYSSFSYLKHLPLDTLKIDRSFVRELAVAPDDAAITTAIIAMGHALELNVVAEGVETEAHRKLLRDQGCDEMQGYLFGRPAAAESFAECLVQQRQLPATGGRRSRAVAW